MYKILVTCGRGFENYVIREIELITLFAEKIRIINEGKISFNIDFNQVAENKHQCSVLQSIFNLKTVERVMLLLYYADLNENNTIKGLKGKVN